jgi:protein TonB
MILHPRDKEDVMAYADIKTRPSPISLGGAFIINGVLIAGIIFAGPEISGIVADKPTIIDFINPSPPPEPTTLKPRPKVEPDSGTIAERIKTPPAPPSGAQGDNGTLTETALGTEGTGAIFPPGGGTLIKDPPLVEPVFKTAMINPRYRGEFQPEYPPGLVRQEIEGSVTLRVLIGVDGRVKTVEPLRFDDEDFLKVTRAQALRKWRFLPATRDGVAVESWREMTVRFEIPR